MKFIIGFCPDFAKLERPEQVEAVQMKYNAHLQKYLKYKYGPEANARFSAGIMMAALAREANEIERTRLPV